MTTISATLTTYTGENGATPTLAGAGFGANQTVTIRWLDVTNHTSTLMTTALSDANGLIAANLTISEQGPYTDTAGIQVLAQTTGDGIFIPYTTLPAASANCATQGNRGVGNFGVNVDPATEFHHQGPDVLSNTLYASTFRVWVRPTDVVTGSGIITGETPFTTTTWATDVFSTTDTNLAQMMNDNPNTCALLELSLYNPGHSWISQDTQVLSDTNPSTWTDLLNDYSRYVNAFMSQWMTYEQIPGLAPPLTNVQTTNEPNEVYSHTLVIGTKYYSCR